MCQRSCVGNKLIETVDDVDARDLPNLRYLHMG